MSLSSRPAGTALRMRRLCTYMRIAGRRRNGPGERLPVG
jgi:hypothetical protein